MTYHHNSYYYTHLSLAFEHLIEFISLGHQFFLQFINPSIQPSYLGIASSSSSTDRGGKLGGEGGREGGGQR